MAVYTVRNTLPKPLALCRTQAMRSGADIMLTTFANSSLSLGPGRIQQEVSR